MSYRRSRPRFPLPLREKIKRNIASLRAQGIEPTPSMLAMAEELSPPERKPRPARLPHLDSPHKEPLERDIQKAIIEALKLQPHVIKVVRFNSGGAYYRNAQGRDGLVLFSSEPVVDLYVLMYSEHETVDDDVLVYRRTAWLEVKRPSWKSPTDARETRQAQFLDAVRQAGCIGAFVRSVDEALDAIK